jgi:large subunit ribosomal protein L29
VTRPSDLRQMADDELARQLDETRTELFNLRFQIVTGQVTNVSRIKYLRKEAARLITLLHERDLAGAAKEGF